MEHDAARLAPSHTLVDLDALTLTWRVRAEQLDSALATIASVLETAPSQQALALANKEIARAQSWPAMDAGLTAREHAIVADEGHVRVAAYDQGGPLAAASRAASARIFGPYTAMCMSKILTALSPRKRMSRCRHSASRLAAPRT